MNTPLITAYYTRNSLVLLVYYCSLRNTPRKFYGYFFGGLTLNNLPLVYEPAHNICQSM